MGMHFDFDTMTDRRNTNCGKWDTMDKKYGRKDMIHLGVADMDSRRRRLSLTDCAKCLTWASWATRT
mgnify:CR=1 FL=1